MCEPSPSDLSLRGSFSEGFFLLGATSRDSLAGPLLLMDALTAAKAHGARWARAGSVVWQEIVGERGRPVEPLARLAVA